MAKVHLGPSRPTQAITAGHHSEIFMDVLSTAYKSIAETSQRKLIFRGRENADELVNFDTLAFNSSFIRSITLSLPNLPQLNSLDPCPVIVLPETSQGIIKKVEAILQTGTCIIRDRVEAQEVLEVANILGLPISMLVPENRSGLDTSSPIIFSNVKVKTEIPNPEPEVTNLLQPRFSFRTVKCTTSTSNSATSEVSCVQPNPGPPNMIQGYKCAICKKPGGNVLTGNKKDTIFQKEIQLEAHYIGQHFTEEIGKHIKDTDTCGICGKIVPKGRLPLHIGLIHKKIKSILRAAKLDVEPILIPRATEEGALSPTKKIKKISSPKMRRPLALTHVPSSSPEPSQITPTTESENSPPTRTKSDNIPPSSKTNTSLAPITNPTNLKSAAPSVVKPTCPVVSTPPGKTGHLKEGPRKTPPESGKKTSLSKPTLPVHLTKTMSKDALPPSTPKQSEASLPEGSALSGEKSVLPGGHVTPDDRSRRHSILSNCDTPHNAMDPVDEFLTKWDGKPGRGSNKKPLTRKNCNYDLKCEVCGTAQKTSLALEIHTIGHFKESLEAKVKHFMTDDKRCKICGDCFKTKNWLINHLGSKHGYINEVLVDQGFAVLPCPVNSSGYSASKQQQLVRIKTERKGPLEDEAKEQDGLRDQLMKDTGAA